MFDPRLFKAYNEGFNEAIEMVNKAISENISNIKDPLDRAAISLVMLKMKINKLWFISFYDIKNNKIIKYYYRKIITIITERK